MNGTTHMAVGGMTGGLVLAYGIAHHTAALEFSGYIVYPIVVTIAAAVGGLAPDVDMKRSKAGHLLRLALRIGLAISALFLAIMSFVPKTGIDILDSAINANSGIGRRFPLILAAFCVLIWVIVEKSKHRGFTHTPIALLIIAAPLIYLLIAKLKFTGADIAVSAQIGFVLGWFSHMVIDTFNYPGTPWLWPVVQNHFNFMRVDSGTKEETVFLVISAGVFVAGYALIIF